MTADRATGDMSEEIVAYQPLHVDAGNIPSLRELPIRWLLQVISPSNRSKFSVTGSRQSEHRATAVGLTAQAIHLRIEVVGLNRSASPCSQWSYQQNKKRG